MVCISFPSGVHCHSQSDHFAKLHKCHWYKWQVTVSYMRSNITQFQDHFLFKIPVLFCNHLSGFANPQNQTFSHRLLCIRVWPQRIKAMCWTRPSRVRQILLQQTNCWHYHDYHDWQSLSQEASLHLPWTQKGRWLIIPWPNELKRNAEWRSFQGFKATFELFFSTFSSTFKVLLTVSMMPPLNFVRPV